MFEIICSLSQVSCGINFGHYTKKMWANTLKVFKLTVQSFGIQSIHGDTLSLA